MKKTSSSSSNTLGSFLSPGTPNQKQKKPIDTQKGRISEKVSSQPEITSTKIHGTVFSSSLSPFNSGRTIPSKWDDAERWINSSSPSNRNSSSSCTSSYAQFQRRPKSKSGPIVPPGTGYCYSNNHYCSPVNPIPMRNSLVVKNSMMGSSPFTTGVFAPDAVSSLHHFYSAHENGVMYSSSPMFDENCVDLQSLSSAHLWSELICDPSSPNYQDEKHDESRNESTMISPLSKHDKGTQMSSPETENDAESSSTSSPASTIDRKNSFCSKLEIRDVEVDSEATVIRCSKSNATKFSSIDCNDLKKSSMDAQGSDLDIADSTLDISKFESKEAKIIAWESLQKAKAEAAIRKLEMKLEKKKSSSMDKILNKLRRAQIKAEKMRSIIPTQQQQVSKVRRIFSFSKYFQIWSPRSCFTIHHL